MTTYLLDNRQNSLIFRRCIRCRSQAVRQVRVGHTDGIVSPNGLFLLSLSHYNRFGLVVRWTKRYKGMEGMAELEKIQEVQWACRGCHTSHSSFLNSNIRCKKTYQSSYLTLQTRTVITIFKKAEGKLLLYFSQLLKRELSAQCLRAKRTT